ncbi:S-ribosylhomocysteine lyase [Actinotignum urinale]|uniref:S-ribosylhomocysteine lyase n=2 Tax=Actinotignum urinale TaxID=190146 RepID=A0AAW9HMM7_9ACTO|nr:S-ribosylhomocysteine lyase [Actinotignum urinale]MDY5128471.1 S-ribosylhomocysteine lyase [Actinotignum urinale]MDY5151217.1 S-ribosylhomocysteine lyase [Actinotignum urinale]MDY5155163.1 S-ribosylhomocysteine lyase [Actinotignum urinale]MDY5160551.1 S-ribosylhomocysteine lyase [Actinotignum urinale]WIK59798.1 S-ribosylhomocysteine lyase [Actinotignum urinale]
MVPAMNVESFNLDHTKVLAPYIRVADIKTLPHGDVLTKYDVRFCQPNKEHLTMPAIHSIEHCFAEFSRNHNEHVIDFSPMGCQTGFYLLLNEEPNVPATCELVETTFRDIIHATEVPAANERQCGWGENHNLKVAQEAIAAMLYQRDSWEKVMA